MKARFTRERGRGGSGSSLATATKVALLVNALIASVVAVVIVSSSVSAQPVGNPGNLNFLLVDGNIALGSQNFGLTPNPLPECSDGENNDGDPTDPGAAQDVLIDFPADPQCTSALDNSEVASGFQPKENISISGTVNAAGVVNVPSAGIFFPPIYQYAVGTTLTVRIQPTSNGTGTINPLTGAASLSISIRIKLEGAPAGTDLGSNCQVGPISLPMVTGTTAPPPPNEPITGVPYNPTTGQATFVNNSFSVPGASGCGPLNAANGPLNGALGIPAPAGTNTAILVLEASPKITKGVNASNVPSVTTGVAPLTVNFNGTGSNAVKPIASYQWDFDNNGTGDATGSTAFTTYPTPGTYNAKLTVTDTDGDKDSQIQTIVVTEPPNVPPTAAIGSSGSGGLAPYVVTFDGTGSSDPDGSIASYAWDFGNDRTASTAVASTTYAQPGTYTATLTVTDNRGATGTATRQIVVTGAPNVPPTAVIRTVSVAGTIPLTVNLSGSTSSDPDGSIVAYAWDLGNGQTATGPSAQAIYTAAGTYTVSLVVTDDRGATATQTLTIEVSLDSNIPPSADFTATPDSGVGPLVVSLDGTASSDVDGTIATYAWNFGNGQNGSGATPPPVTYTIPGTYTATLTVTDNKGATGTVSKTITVNRPPNVTPVANVTATPTSGSAPLLVQLSSAGSSDADGAITGYLWNFGNGQTSTSPSPSATYTTAGSFTVSLTVTDNDGASAVKSTTVVVSPPNVAPVPVISANPLSGSAPLVVNVNGAGSSDSDGSIVTYAWDFGNGQTATGALASTTYTSQGSYLIRLTVTDNRGTSRSTTTTVVAGPVNLRPIAAITALPTAGPAPLLVQLGSLGSNDPDGSIVSYAWNFGNGQTAVGTTTQVNYTAAGTYTVTLTVTDNKGATGTATEQIVVDPPVTVRDRLRLQFTGSIAASFDGSITGGNLQVLTDAFGVSQVNGTATYGASGTVGISINRFLWFNAYLGTITVNDPASGLTNVQTPVIFAPLSRPSTTSVRGTTTGNNTQFQPYRLNFTIDDRV